MFDTLPPELRSLRDRFEALGRAIAPEVAAAAPGALPPAAWGRLGDAGAFALVVPASAGGLGQSALHAVAAWEGLGLGCPDLGFLFAGCAHLFGAVLPLAMHGSAEQIAEWLPPLLDGRRIGAHGVTERDAGSDVRAMQSAMVEADGRLTLRGHKSYITNAPRADDFVVYLRDGDGLGAVLLRRDDGVTTTPQGKLGLRGAPMGELVFDGLSVPGARRLGPRGSGMAMFTTALEWERACVFAPFLGAMDRQLRRCVERARQRRAFGRRIGEFQAISHRIADMKTRLDLSRMLVYRAAAAKDGGARAPLEAAQAKLYVAEAFLQSSLDALRLFGGAGYLEDAEAAADVRDALGGPLFSGTSDIQKNIVARFLGVG